MEMVKLTHEQIRKDNPHFGPVIREIEPITPYQSKRFPQFTHRRVVGAKDSNCGHFKGDGWATYLYDSIKQKWVLGAN